MDSNSPIFEVKQVEEESLLNINELYDKYKILEHVYTDEGKIKNLSSNLFEKEKEISVNIYPYKKVTIISPLASPNKNEVNDDFTLYEKNSNRTLSEKLKNIQLILAHKYSR